MRALPRALMFLLICCAGAGAAAPALAPSLPPATSLESCTQSRVEGGWGSNWNGTLRADCPDDRNRYRATSISADCDGDIANINGKLQCRRYSDIGGGNLPSGSYRLSCYGSRMNGNTLSATCMDTANRRRNTSINAVTCRGRDIGNLDGSLRCTNLPPSGSDQQSCDSATLNGNTLNARCADLNNYPRRSSINISGCRNGDIANEGGRLTCINKGQGGLPSGSYMQTCRGASMNGVTLSANCQTANNSTRRSSLNTSNCRGRDIGNRDGYLNCEAKPGTAPPAGSYQQTCRDATMAGITLTATCQTANNSTRRTSINTGNCRGRDIGNNNGTLTCSGGGAVRPIPAGSYQQTCTSATMNGSMLNATCQTANGSSRRSAINIDNCRGRDIGNRDGTLRCD